MNRTIINHSKNAKLVLILIINYLLYYETKNLIFNFFTNFVFYNKNLFDIFIVFIRRASPRWLLRVPQLHSHGGINSLHYLISKTFLRSCSLYPKIWLEFSYTVYMIIYCNLIKMMENFQKSKNFYFIFLFYFKRNNLG